MLCNYYESLFVSINKLNKEIGYFTGLSSTPRPSFSHFLELPVEIRCLIWSYSVESRVIEVRLKESKHSTISLRSIAQIPAILHTCRESRDVGLNVYRQAFSTSSSPATTYVNFHQDIIYFGTKAVCRSYPRLWSNKETWSRPGCSDFENIQRLAISMRLYWSPATTRLEDLKSLEEVLLVCREETGTQRSWDLGRNPRLIPMSEHLYAQLVPTTCRSNLAQAAENGFHARVGLHCFVKAPGDKWWFK